MSIFKFLKDTDRLFNDVENVDCDHKDFKLCIMKSSWHLFELMLFLLSVSQDNKDKRGLWIWDLSLSNVVYIESYKTFYVGVLYRSILHLV